MGSNDVNYDSSDEPLALYDATRTQVQAKYNGQAFITEYAEPQTPSASGASDDIWTKLFNSYPYLTRLSARLSANQETLDPVFVPAPNAPDISNDIYVSQKVDPLVLHGCSTQNAISSRVAAEFAKSHTRFPDLNFTVGYPSNWVLSEVTVKPILPDVMTVPDNESGLQPVYVYAPQPVTSATFDAYFKGQPTPPMFVFVQITFSDESWLADAVQGSSDSSQLGNINPALSSLLLEALGRDSDTIHLPDLASHLTGQNVIRLSARPNLGNNGDGPGGAPPIAISAVLFGMLATDGDWQANAPLYKDMLDYAWAHLYWLDASTRDSLFLTASTRNDTNMQIASDIFTLPLPDGWAARTDANGDVLITPENAGADRGPTMRLSIVGGVGGFYYCGGGSRFDGMVLSGAQATTDPTQLADLLKNAARPLALYGFPTSPIDSATQSALTQCPKDLTTVKATPFQHNGLTGQVTLTTDYIAAVYTPDAQYKTVLQMMMNAYLSGYHCQQGPDNPYNIPPADATPPADQANPSCPTSPPLRLQIGGQGRVTPGAPDNLREAADGSSPVLAVLKAGETFTVIEGPVCDPVIGVTWWEIRYQTPAGNTLIGWIAEGQGKTYFVEPVSS
jgi:hypothetical protein